MDHNMEYIRKVIRHIEKNLQEPLTLSELTAGAPGKRLALPNSEILIYQLLISGGMQGQATDIQIRTNWLLKHKHKINTILSEVTGQPLERIEHDVERDYFMTAEEVKVYGLIDSILERKP